MFDLIAGKTEHVPSTPAIPIVISTTVQVSILSAIVASSFLLAARELPVVPDVLAFVAEMPSGPLPPPPPVSVRPTAVSRSRPAPAAEFSAPVEAPRSLEPELLPARDDEEEGTPDGVEGGVPGGAIGGVLRVV